MKAVEAGVSNFVKFQSDMRTFRDEFWEAKKQEEKQAKKDKESQDAKDARRSRIHFWLLGILSGMIVALFGFLLTHVSNYRISLAPTTTHITEATTPPY